MATRADLDHVRELMALATGDEKHEESSTSTLDALWVLYDRVLRVDPASPREEARDRFILSKGHGPSAYYAVLAAKGFFPEDVLAGFLEWGNPKESVAGRYMLEYSPYDNLAKADYPAILVTTSLGTAKSAAGFTVG